MYYLPTPESPSKTILKMKSYDSLSMVRLSGSYQWFQRRNVAEK